MNPENEKIRAEIETIKGQLAELDAERKNKMGSVNDLFQDRKSIKAELDAEFDRMRALKAEFRQQKNDFHVYQQEQYARKQEQWKAQKQEEQTYRLNAQAEREREAAEIPAYTDEINLCNALIKFLNSFGTNKSAAVSAPTEGSSGSSPTPTGIRKVEGLPEGAVLMKKKDDEDYLVMGGGKKGGKKGRKQQLSNTDVAPTAKPFKVDFALIDQFGKLKIDLPTSVAGVPKAIEALETKLGWYKENQASATAKAKAAAEAKIAALSRSNSGEDVSSTPAAAGDAKLDESAKDTAPAAKIEA
ncbi:hypothetical protein DFS34DRAFT_622083 [Phlyctochytrium arcticum]|nr:hypothetical protein DFS34DRAFT_622083 [Phlyctochytrium arcticum]